MLEKDVHSKQYLNYCSTAAEKCKSVYSTLNTKQYYIAHTHTTGHDIPQCAIPESISPISLLAPPRGNRKKKKNTIWDLCIDTASHGSNFDGRRTGQDGSKREYQVFLRKRGAGERRLSPINFHSWAGGWCANQTVDLLKSFQIISMKKNHVWFRRLH